MNPAVKVKTELLVACMTCGICNKFVKDATTVVECLHTFCRKCIYKKLSDEEMDRCPACNTHLGCAPLEKLRSDNNWKNVRGRIFPYKGMNDEATEVITPVTQPAKRKERSLSSLVINSPKVPSQSGMTGRRSKSTARKASRGSSFTIQKPLKKGQDSIDDPPNSSSSRETLTKFTQNRKQNSVSAEPSIHRSPDREGEKGSERLEGRSNIWRPLTCLVEAANRSKSSKTSQEPDARSSAQQSHENEGVLRKTQNKENRLKGKGLYEKNSVQEPEKTVKSRRGRQKKADTSGEIGISPQSVIDAASAARDRRNDPVWFSLVASDDQEGKAPLPQISASYLRIKNGNIPVSFIQKYLQKKLDLASEDEVDIRCMGQSIIPTITLNNLVDLWLQTTGPERVPVAIGSSAKDFVMVLTYARKSLAA